MADRSVVIRLRGDISDLQAKMVAAGKSVGLVADKMTGAEKESVKFRKGLDSLGSAGAKVGIAAGAGVAIAVKAFADFDQAMSGVAAATHASRTEMEQLRVLALQTGADTAFSANEAADGIEQLAKAGVSTADIMGGALQGALDLAAAGTVDVGFAAETAATAMTQFGLSGEKVPHIADLLAAAAGKAQGEVADMSMALKQSGLVANQMGLSLEESTGALGAFASAGLLGSDAGTSFKTMLMRLLPQSKEAGDAMEAIGFNAFDAQGNMKSLAEVAGGLRQGLKDMTDEQRQATLATIFGQDAIRAATVLYDEGARGIGNWIDKVNDQGYAAETAAIKMDNLAGDIEKLKGALSTLFIEGGSNGNDFLRGATQSTEDFVNALAEMPDWASKSAFTLAAITAVTGGGLWFGSKVITGIADTRVALADLGVQSATTGRVLKSSLQMGAILISLNLLDTALDDLFDTQFEGSKLDRSLTALAEGRVTGEVLGQYGADLSGFAGQVKIAGDSLGGFYDKIPLVGGFLSGPTGDALANLDQLDASLARWVEGGRADEAAAVFDRLLTAASAKGIDAADVNTFFDQYAIAVDNAADDARDFGVAQRGVVGALDETEGPAGNAARGLSGVETAADRAAFQASELESALGDLEVVLAGRQRSRAYEQSLDDVAARLKERRELIGEIKDAEAEVANAKTASERDSARERVADLEEQLKGFALTLDDGKQAGREWNTLLETVASSALNAASDLEGMDRVRYLNNARKDFIDMATKILGSRKEARLLADDLELVHQKKVKPTIDVDTKPAEVDVRKFYRFLENLPPATVKLFVDTVMGKNDIGDMGDPRFARGFASGGWTGNYPINEIAGVVHGREFVVNAKATAENRALLEAINRGARGYREGGYVAAQSSTTNYYGGGTVSLSDGDIARLAQAMSQARPIYGDMHVQPHDYSEFRRQMEQDRRLVAGGGVRF